VGIAIWLLILLGTYAITTGGIVPASHQGLAYDLPSHRIRFLDIQRLIAREQVRDVEGQVVIDPAFDSVRVVTVGPSGHVVTKFTSAPTHTPRKTFVVLIADPDACYADVVAAIDRLRNQGSDSPSDIWIAGPLTSESDLTSLANRGH